ncbi:MAG TPA: 2-dehydropantoate 2-reductase N-terminal domain-containing protein [Devosiaceae bacterium]
MRVVIYGVGAIGGVIAARLALIGRDVIGIARGAQLAAIRQHGLLLRTPDKVETAHFSCVGAPDAIDWRPDDVIFLTMKTQDTQAALQALRDAGVTDQAIFCFQNGVANETMALRLFPNVYGVMVGMPADYLTPGEVNVFGSPVHGIFDIGRFPRGVDAVTRAVAELLAPAGFMAAQHEDVMRSKYAKLLMNLGNIISAALADEAVRKPYLAAARAEADAVLAAAGITADKEAGIHRGFLKMHDIPGVRRSGSSSSQSLVRGAGSIETDYLNGEIVLLARRLGLPAPVNSYFCGLAHHMLAANLAPGSIDPAELARALPQIGA